MSDSLDFQMGVITGALLIGLACGLLPLLAGLFTDHLSAGAICFAACAIAGFSSGLCLALPVAFVTTAWILATGPGKAAKKSLEQQVWPLAMMIGAALGYVIADRWLAKAGYSSPGHRVVVGGAALMAGGAIAWIMRGLIFWSIAKYKTLGAGRFVKRAVVGGICVGVLAGAIVFVDWPGFAAAYRARRAEQEQDRIDRMLVSEFGVGLAALEAESKRQAAVKKSLEKRSARVRMTQTLAGMRAKRSDFKVITSVTFDGHSPKSDDLAPLREAPDLERLSLLGCYGITEEALRHLVNCPKLHTLSLHSTGISDERLRIVAKLSNLQTLILARTKITDDGLLELASLEKLVVLDVRETKVTEAGICRLQEAIRPRQLQIEYDRKSSFRR